VFDASFTNSLANFLLELAQKIWVFFLSSAAAFFLARRAAFLEAASFAF